MKINKRNATLGDAAQLLEWRNNPSVREFSLNSELILIEEHMSWLSNRLERIVFEPFLIFQLDNELIGMSRLEIVLGTLDEFEISILVDQNQQNKGIGTRILQMTCERFFSLHPDKTIVAKVHHNNLVSQKLFQNAGFRLQSSKQNFLYYKKSSTQ
jgi:spore coat polysaccharide biosynthesis protein SpsF